MRKFILLMALYTGLTSCEEEFDPALETRETELLVVESVLTNLNINQEVNLSLPHTSINGDPVPVSGAFVQVVETTAENLGMEGLQEGDTVFNFIETPPGSGNYVSNPFRAVFGRVYVLIIGYQGQSYFAVDFSDPVGELPTINIVPAQEDPSAFTLLFEENGLASNYIDHDISWTESASCTSSDDCRSEVIFYDLKTVDVHELYKPDKNEFSFPAGSIIIRTKYSVNERYGNFLRAVLSETEWRGGLFDIQRANAVTNLSEGAIGFFAVSTVVTDTTLVQ